MRIVRGTFNGTGAALYLCLGAIPRRIEFFDMETGTNQYRIVWDQAFRSLEMVDGLRFLHVIAGGTDTCARLTKQTGVSPFEGGVALTSTDAGTTTYGEGVYLKRDTIEDYRENTTYGATAAITDWTLGVGTTTSTGNFNVDTVASSRIGEGSRIVIKETVSGLIKEAVITALTAQQGISANEVGLSRPIATGKVLLVGGMYDYIPMVAAEIPPAGVYLADTTMNANDALIGFIAELD